MRPSREVKIDLAPESADDTLDKCDDRDDDAGEATTVGCFSDPRSDGIGVVSSSSMQGWTAGDPHSSLAEGSPVSFAMLGVVPAGVMPMVGDGVTRGWGELGWQAASY